MDPNVDLLNSINYIEAVNTWRAVYHHIPDTNTISPDDIKLYNIPKGTVLNLTQFYDWY